MRPSQIIGYVCGVVIVALVVLTVWGSWGTIDAGNCGVLLHMGATTGQVKPPGFYMKEPWLENVISMNVQIQKIEDETEGASKDLQTVKVKVALNYSLDPSQAATIYQNVGENYASTLIDPALKESVKATLSQFTAEELITKREQVKDGIVTLIGQKVAPSGIKVTAVNIVNFDFSATFNAAIEAKVTAEQNALAAKNKLEQVKFEAEQAIAKANGTAQAISIEAKALQSNPAILQLRAIEKWDGKLPNVTGGAIPMLDVGKMDHLSTAP